MRTQKVKNDSSKKKVVKNKSQQKTIKLKTYFGFWTRVIISLILFLVFFITCLFVASKTFIIEKTNPIYYSDVNEIAYKVYLKDNVFYRDKYLGMNRAYVANLIDYIDIDYSYLFDIDKLTNINFDYKIIAELMIENSKGTSFVDEKYVIKESEQDNLINSGTFSINENVIIDYGYYNKLANKFKVETGVDIIGYLNVYLEVYKKTDDNLNYEINEITKSNIRIPLSERAIEITFDANNGTVKKQVYPAGNINIDFRYLVLEISLFLGATLFLIQTIKYLTMLVNPKTPYDKYVKKILRDYDRLIVETKTSIDMTNYNIIKVKRFDELLDVRDNLKLPIVYINIIKHEKGMFYIKNNMDIYRYIVKNIDLK